MGCDFTTGAEIEVCAAFGQPARVSALFEAELSECSMGGNLCGFSTGEALSRWCAAVTSNNALGDFATGPTWVDAGMPDFVTHTDHSDVVAKSTGCGMVFLSWLLSQGHGLPEIAQAMVAAGNSGTLAQIYADLTSKPASSAFPTFIAAVRLLPGGVNDDDPFGGMANALHRVRAAHPAVTLAGRINTAMLQDIAAGKTAEQLIGSIRAIIDAGPSTPLSFRADSVCTIGSRRLRPPE